MDSIQITVARGKTIEADGRRYGPGETVTVADAEVARLQAAGFIVDPVTGEQPTPRSF